MSTGRSDYNVLIADNVDEDVLTQTLDGVFGPGKYSGFNAGFVPGFKWGIPLSSITEQRANALVKTLSEKLGVFVRLEPLCD